MVSVHYDPLFYHDVNEAATYLDTKQPGLGREFILMVDDAVTTIRGLSDLQTSGSQDIQKVHLKKFKKHSVRYRYLLNTDEIQILSVTHSSRGQQHVNLIDSRT